MDRKTKFRNGITVSKKDFDALYRKVKTEVSVGHKLKPIHLECSSFDRQNVRLACELLSQTVASMIRHYFPSKGALADFIDCADKSFNIFTSKNCDHPDFTRSIFGGENLQKQVEILKKYRELIQSTKFFGTPRFHYGLIGAINAIIELQQTLQNDFNIPSFPTSHTTQGSALK